MQRMAKALLSQKRNGFVMFHRHDAYHAQIGMRVNTLYASTTCVLLSVWGALETSREAVVVCRVTRPIVSTPVPLGEGGEGQAPSFSYGVW